MRKSTLSIDGKSIRHLGAHVKPQGEEFLGRAAHWAVVQEAMTTPKPGLVDAEGCGCHSDMSCQTLLVSASALSPFWHLQARTGLGGTPPQDAMASLRAVGVEMDVAMFAATGGVNAHKGLIYCLSLLLYGVGYTIYRGEPLAAGTAAGFAAEAVKGCVESELYPLLQLKAERSLTNGEKLFLRHGVTGIRGEAENAFPSIVKGGLPELQRALADGICLNDAAICALLAIMEINEDSNVIHRGGFAFWNGEYKRMAAETRAVFRPGSGDYSPLTALESRFLPLGVSPGGAADLLACTLFLHKIISSACLH